MDKALRTLLSTVPQTYVNGHKHGIRQLTQSSFRFKKNDPMPEAIVNAAHLAAAMVLQKTGIAVRLHQEVTAPEATVNDPLVVVPHQMTIMIEVTDDAAHLGDTMDLHHLGGTMLTRTTTEDHPHLHEVTATHMHAMEIHTLALEAHLAMGVMVLEAVVAAILHMRIVHDTRRSLDEQNQRLAVDPNSFGTQIMAVTFDSFKR